MTRAATSALVGALVVVVGWTAWSTLGLHEASESAVPVDTAVVDATPPSAGPPRAPPRQEVSPAAASAVVALAPPKPAPAPPPPLREGLVMEHGMPTAVHALAVDAAAQPAMAAAVDLPADARPQDAEINRAGMVALTRSPDANATANAATANPPRVPAAAHAP